MAQDTELFIVETDSGINCGFVDDKGFVIKNYWRDCIRRIQLNLAIKGECEQASWQTIVPVGLIERSGRHYNATISHQYRDILPAIYHISDGSSDYPLPHVETPQLVTKAGIVSFYMATFSALEYQATGSGDYAAMPYRLALNRPCSLLLNWVPSHEGTCAIVLIGFNVGSAYSTNIALRDKEVRGQLNIGNIDEPRLRIVGHRLPAMRAYNTGPH